MINSFKYVLNFSINISIIKFLINMSFFSIFNPILFRPSYPHIYYYNDDDYYIRRREEERKLQVNLNFNKDFEKYFKDQIKEIKDKITQDLFQIEPFYIEETTNLINLIIEGENYENKLFNEIKKIVSENAEKNKLVKHLNIILAGPTGAGKSTLINKILNLIGEKAIKTAIGAPCTMGDP